MQDQLLLCMRNASTHKCEFFSFLFQVYLFGLKGYGIVASRDHEASGK